MLLRLVVILLTLPLLLGACRPQAPDISPVSTDLLVSDRPDSVITPADHRDFSGIIPTGQGPKGSLIRWDIKSSVYAGYVSQSFATYTYDQQKRLVGMFECDASYGQQTVSKAYYQDDFLASIKAGSPTSPRWNLPLSPAYLQSLTGELTTVRTYYISRFQYNAEKQLKQILVYEPILETEAFRLEKVIQLQYNARGQLQVTRTINRPGQAGMVTYWQNGDRIREETIYPLNSVASKLTSVTTYTYNQDLNPFAPLTLRPDLWQSQHNLTRITYSINDQIQPVEQRAFSRRYNAQGQLISQTVGDEKGSGYWLGYTFSYAP